jgi:hypothetical protein
MAIERAIFEPDEIAVQLGRSVSAGLRVIADAIDAGQMDARVLQCAANGLSADWRDTRAHVLVKLDLASEIRKPINMLERLGTDGNKELP